MHKRACITQGSEHIEDKVESNPVHPSAADGSDEDVRKA
jgi:hypothetical protein